ncbi:unnamed protein product [Pleuronectes platessa]|uniref:Uncharacterized protein n=1 Tax=Pleuronectes platessa TaxID=8262 RepID=A0A9N7V788_PLEPL|nr:unnamed protein product [Pleuronectes platessa]
MNYFEASVYFKSRCESFGVRVRVTVTSGFLSCAGRGDGRGLQGPCLQLDAGLRPVRMLETFQHECRFTSQDISRPVTSMGSEEE